MEAAAKENQRFERVEVPRDEALSMFQENKFKVCGRHDGKTSMLLLLSCQKGPVTPPSTCVGCWGAG
jgi:threonyl-tRNA synthetase